MQRKGIKRGAVEAPKSVLFTKPFDGSYNDFPIKVTKYELDKIVELPLNVYEWIQKFNVCKDA